MKGRPILFSGEMVRAILDGQKTQTRRVIKPQPSKVVDAFEKGLVNAAWQAGFVDVQCPYGEPGDRLWVRETWRRDYIAGAISGPAVRYRADNSVLGRLEAGDIPDRIWRPSIFMPRWASRLTLEVTGMRVERLQDITEEDARAEGATTDEWVAANQPFRSHRLRFEQIWNDINAARGFGWPKNPWVWVIEFERVEANRG